MKGLLYENDHFAQTPHLRLSLGVRDDNKQGLSPEGHRLACDNLASGNLWEVVGHRNATPQTAWRSEVVERSDTAEHEDQGFIPVKRRARHHVTPNIEYIDDIFNEERKEIAWSDFIDALPRTRSETRRFRFKGLFRGRRGQRACAGEGAQTRICLSDPQQYQH